MSRVFTLDDQRAFADLSGDTNPLHVDPVLARRYMFGQPVVHGMHSVLWALDVWLQGRTDPLRIARLKATFHKPVLLDERVQSSSTSDRSQDVTIKVTAGSGLAATIRVGWIPSDSPMVGCPLDGPRDPGQPRELSDEAVRSASGSLALYLDTNRVARMFPHLSRCVPPQQIAAMLATTRLVGVECPGLHSLYSELDLLATEGNEESRSLSYEVTRFYKNVGLVLLRVRAAGWEGTIKAFVRPAPQEQAAYSVVKPHVARGEFADQRALVVGGSRGLGEVVTKLLCAGGATVTLTYCQGREDAHRVVQEIGTQGGAVESLHLDVLNPATSVTEQLQSGAVTHLYYFATPRISVTENGAFSTELFAKYCAYYVTGFESVVRALKGAALKVFLPSTVFIDELPADLAEYAAAKAAGETLASHLQKHDAGLIVYSPRLPRMATDQTVGLLPVGKVDPVPVMVQALRAFRDCPAPAGAEPQNPLTKTIPVVV